MIGSEQRDFENAVREAVKRDDPEWLLRILRGRQRENVEAWSFAARAQAGKCCVALFRDKYQRASPRWPNWIKSWLDRPGVRPALAMECLRHVADNPRCDIGYLEELLSEGNLAPLWAAAQAEAEAARMGASPEIKEGKQGKGRINEGL